MGTSSKYIILYFCILISCMYASYVLTIITPFQLTVETYHHNSLFSESEQNRLHQFLDGFEDQGKA